MGRMKWKRRAYHAEGGRPERRFDQLLLLLRGAATPAHHVTAVDASGTPPRRPAALTVERDGSLTVSNPAWWNATPCGMAPIRVGLAVACKPRNFPSSLARPPACCCVTPGYVTHAPPPRGTSGTSERRVVAMSEYISTMICCVRGMCCKVRAKRAAAPRRASGFQCAAA
jgi:hypothetical protein